MLTALKTTLRRWNRERLGKRSAAKVKRQSLVSYQLFILKGIDAGDGLDLMPCLEALQQHGINIRRDVSPCNTNLPKLKGLEVYGALIWATPRGSPPPNIFGLYVNEQNARYVQANLQWFEAARFIWAPSMSVLRQLIAQAVPSSKIYLLPTQRCASDVPGADLFYTALQIQQFFASRFLLAHQIIGFDEFYRQRAAGFRPLADTLCLGVVEYTARLDDFMSEETGINYFPGLRHTTGWVGCGLSYKLLCCLAKRDQLRHVAICEDDVLLPPDWQILLKRIYQRIQPAFDKGEAHVFAGIVTMLPDDAILLANEDFEERKLVTLNKTTGAVFNLYSETAIDHMSQWNDARHNLVDNQMDRYLMNAPNLRTMALVPFFVQHKEDIVSTLWGTNNGVIYSAAFQKTQQRISQMMLDAANDKL